MMKMAHCHSILHPWSTISFSYMICTYPDMHTVTFEPIKVNLFKAMPSVRGWRIWIGRRGEGRSAATAVTWAGTEWTAPTTSWKPTFLVNTMVNETIHDHSWPWGNSPRISLQLSFDGQNMIKFGVSKWRRLSAEYRRRCAPSQVSAFSLYVHSGSSPGAQIWSISMG